MRDLFGGSGCRACEAFDVACAWIRDAPTEFRKREGQLLKEFCGEIVKIASPRSLLLCAVMSQCRDGWEGDVAMAGNAPHRSCADALISVDDSHWPTKEGVSPFQGGAGYRWGG